MAALAARAGGVLLLSQGSTMPAATAAYLRAHDPTGARTVPVGGPAAAAAPAPAAAHAVVGADRYDTARLLALAGPQPVSTVGLAVGTTWPDALAGAAVMGQIGGPLLLSPPDHLDTATSSALQTLAGGERLRTAVVFGDQDAISPAVLSAAGSFLSRN